MKEHDKEKISLYLDGLLTKEEEKEIEGLLSSSEECREYYDQIKMMKEDMLSLSEIPAPVGFASEIMKEINRVGADILAIGCEKIYEIDKKIDYIFTDADFKFEAIKSFINIPVFQILSYINAVEKNLDTDNIKNLSYVIKI